VTDARHSPIKSNPWTSKFLYELGLHMGLARTGHVNHVNLNIIISWFTFYNVSFS
jgi:hypothetical protein